MILRFHLMRELRAPCKKRVVEVKQRLKVTRTDSLHELMSFDDTSARALRTGSKAGI